MAKRNLGKAKIKPMLVAGLCLTGVSELPLKHTLHDAVRSHGLGASPLLAWHFALQIQATSHPFPSEVSNLFDKYWGSGEYFSTSLVSV